MTRRDKETLSIVIVVRGIRIRRSNSLGSFGAKDTSWSSTSCGNVTTSTSNETQLPFEDPTTFDDGYDFARIFVVIIFNYPTSEITEADYALDFIIETEDGEEHWEENEEGEPSVETGA
jgi:hypothetical protein